MSESTPFIDSLKADKRALVERRSRGEKRPRYYSGIRAATQDRLVTTGTQTTGQQADVVISLDLEAALILSSKEVKTKIISFLQSAILAVASTSVSDFVLMSEVVANRAKSYVQVRQDVGDMVSAYTDARYNLLGFIDATARENGVSGAADSVLIPDINSMFGAISDAYVTLSRSDLLGVHDRIADGGTLIAFENAATNRQKELSSWVTVIQTYLV